MNSCYQGVWWWCGLTSECEGVGCRESQDILVTEIFCENLKIRSHIQRFFNLKLLKLCQELHDAGFFIALMRHGADTPMWMMS